MKIGIMGGTFDPIHNGHLMLGETAYHQYQLDKVWFMPNGNPPHKKNIGTDAQTRMEMVKAAIEELEKYIKSCNYYHNKAKNIINASKQIVESFGGKVPVTHEDLITLAGVGNKTANVVQAVAFGHQALPVDTHILRVSNRLGFVNTKNPDICERELKVIFEGLDYGKLHHLLLLFGRYYCTARNPKCEGCVLKDKCKINYYGDK